jgi:hypothetical protein
MRSRTRRTAVGVQLEGALGLSWMRHGSR